MLNYALKDKLLGDSSNKSETCGLAANYHIVPPTMALINNATGRRKSILILLI